MRGVRISVERAISHVKEFHGAKHADKNYRDRAAK